MLRYRKASSLIVMVVLLLIGSMATAEEEAASGRVEIDETQVAFLFSGNLGGGTLHFKGREHRFKIGGLGIGGFGASHISAEGEVYNLTTVADFAGTYVEGSYGYAATSEGQGGLWLKNENDVVMRLKAKQQGLGLSGGASGVVVTME